MGHLTHLIFSCLSWLLFEHKYFEEIMVYTHPLNSKCTIRYSNLSSGMSCLHMRVDNSLGQFHNLIPSLTQIFSLSNCGWEHLSKSIPFTNLTGYQTWIDSLGEVLWKKKPITCMQCALYNCAKVYHCQENLNSMVFFSLTHSRRGPVSLQHTVKQHFMTILLTWPPFKKPFLCNK